MSRFATVRRARTGTRYAHLRDPDPLQEVTSRRVGLVAERCGEHVTFVDYWADDLLTDLATDPSPAAAAERLMLRELTAHLAALFQRRLERLHCLAAGQPLEEEEA
jgi:hypothetical protein